VVLAALPYRLNGGVAGIRRRVICRISIIKRDNRGDVRKVMYRVEQVFLKAAGEVNRDAVKLGLEAQVAYVLRKREFPV
jgi:hypothetical protein